MKVLEQGNPRGPVPKWVGKTVKCSCGFKGKLEEGDPVESQTDRNETYNTIRCLTCGKDIYVR